VKNIYIDSLIKNKMQKENRVFVIGNGMTKFYKPGKHPYEYNELSDIAIKRALDDSKVDYSQIE
jgi:hypothetical protein